MGLLTARCLAGFRWGGVTLVAFGLYIPLIGGVIGVSVEWLLRLGVGRVTLWRVLTTSASYIAVLVAMRHSKRAFLGDSVKGNKQVVGSAMDRDL